MPMLFLSHDAVSAPFIPFMWWYVLLIFFLIFFFFQEITGGMSKSDLQALFTKVDLDRSGNIDSKEFMFMLYLWTAEGGDVLLLIYY